MESASPSSGTTPITDTGGTPPEGYSIGASEVRFRRLFEAAQDGILILNADTGVITAANPFIQQLLHYSDEEMLGKKLWEISPFEDEVKSRIAFKQLQSEDYIRYDDLPLETRDGRAIDVEFVSNIYRSGNDRVIQCNIRDITDRNATRKSMQASDDALRESEARTRFALESAHIGIWDMDYVTGVLKWSAVLEAQYGLAPGQFEGTFEAFIDRIHPGDRAECLEVFQRAVESGADFTVSHRIVWPDSTTRWLLGAGRMVRDESGRPLRAIGISQDVTERRSLEAQFQQAQKMEAMGRLAGGVAHDFNNLLTVILGSCEMLLEDLGPGDAGSADLHHIQAAGTRAAGLTRQLLAFSRKEIIEPTLLDLNAILTDMRPMLGRLIREDIRIELAVSEGVAPIRADRGQLEQVVLNLAINAQDAMPGGGRLTIQSANAVLGERYSALHFGVAAGAYVRLTMTDTGTGMSQATQARLFEPFFTTKEIGKGTGLGLSTVHGIVLSSGGTINVTSEIGRGTSFEVYLPQAAAVPSEIPLPFAAPVHAGTEHILVVEDDAVLRELTRRLLERQGYRVLAAATVSDAFRLYKQNADIDLLLTDVVMPGNSGPQLAQAFRLRRPGLKVLYMSGYNEEGVVHHGLVNPGIAFLHKPFTSDALGRKVRAVLDAP